MKRVAVALILASIVSGSYAKEGQEVCPMDAVCTYNQNGQIINVRGDGSEGELHFIVEQEDINKDNLSLVSNKEECPADAICTYNQDGQIINIRGDGSEGELHFIDKPVEDKVQNTKLKKIRTRLIKKLNQRLTCVKKETSIKKIKSCMKRNKYRKRIILN